MSADGPGLSHHPAPARNALSTARAAFMLCTGPLAWFAQLCIGYALLSWPCYPYDLRLASPVAGYGGTRLVALLLLLACAFLAMAAGVSSWRLLDAAKGERSGGHAELIHVGHGRTRFIALWGLILGFSFAVTTLATLAGFALVPRCAG
jgi:hypothetical protein